MESVEFYCDTNVPGTSEKADYPSQKIIATQRTGASFGNQYNYAIALRILHRYARKDLNENSGLPGNIRSEREGKVGITYSKNKMTDKYAELGTTRWGLELIDLINDTILSVDII